MTPPTISVVVPVRDAARDLERCLESLEHGTRQPLEILVVDDGSVDDPAAVAAAAGGRVLSSGGAGPAAARNVGARAASGGWLLFLDADCSVHPRTLERLVATIAESPGTSAVFGAYDENPTDPGAVSQYRNLLHRYTHLTGRSEASTFWSGCGAVERAAFLAVGGFDEERFPALGMEDIDLGYRLRDAGFRIRLDPRVEVTHAKRWTLGSMLRCDLLERGVPWTILLLERGRVPADLAIGWRQRAGLVGALGLLASPFVVPASSSSARVVAAASLALFLAANTGFFLFLARRRGAGSLLSALPVHWLHSVTAAAAFVVGALRHLAARGRRVRVSTSPARRRRVRVP